MTTRTDDCDESSKIAAVEAETPSVSDAPELAATGESLPEPKAEHTGQGAEADADSPALASTADTPEPTIPEPTIQERSIQEPSIQEPSILKAGSLEPDVREARPPEAVIPDTGIPTPAVPEPVVAEAARVARPVQPPAATRPAPPLAPPFLREHERRALNARPSPEPAKRVSAPPPRAQKPTSRFPLLAATLALAAGLGAAIGAVGVSALINAAPSPATAAAPAPGPSAELDGLKAMVAQHAADLGALKTSLEQSAKATAAQYGKIAERLDRSDRAQAEPAAKLAKIVEALERLEKRPAPAANDVTGSVNPPPPPEAKQKPVILDDYVLRRVFDGVALVEGRRGIIEVEPGATLPGAGRVEEIRRQDGRWVVVTNKGLIVPPR